MLDIFNLEILRAVDVIQYECSGTENNTLLYLKRDNPSEIAKYSRPYS